MEKQPTTRILVVDDNEFTAKALKAQLLSMGYEVIVAYDGEEALEKVHKDRPDLVLLDVVMPRKDGFEVCKNLKKDPETLLIPVIMITSLEDKKYKLRGLDVGADDFITKPPDVHELTARVKSLLRLRNLIEQQKENERIQADLQNKLEMEKLKTEESLKLKNVYKEVISAVTSQKLVLMDKEEMDALFKEGEHIRSLEVKLPEDVGRAREMVREECTRLKIDPEIMEDLVLCTSEMATNALIHSGGGDVYFCRRPDRLQLWVVDRGEGIDFAKLPKATLMRGFSTKFSLGMGYSIALDLADRVLLSTDSNGTTVVLEILFQRPTAEDHLQELMRKWRD